MRQTPRPWIREHEFSVCQPSDNPVTQDWSRPSTDVQLPICERSQDRADSTRTILTLYWLW